jgi:hypothetical protein
VVDRHLAFVAQRARSKVAAVAEFSVELNVALAAAARGRRAGWPALAGRFLRLGPAGWARFFRDSRIVERVASRLRLERAKA